MELLRFKCNSCIPSCIYVYIVYTNQNLLMNRKINPFKGIDLFKIENYLYKGTKQV